MQLWNFQSCIGDGGYRLTRRALKAIISDASDRIGQQLRLTEKQISRTGCALVGFEGGGLRYICKVSLTPSSKRRLQKNAQVLRALEAAESIPQDVKIKFPKSVLKGEVDGHFFCVETKLPGTPGSRWFGSGKASEPLMSEAVCFLTELHVASRAELVLSPAVWEQRIASLFRRVGRLADQLGRAEAYSKLNRFLEKEIMNEQIPFVINHGNYWLGNILFDVGLLVSGVVDWDLAEESGLPLLDLYHLLSRTESQARKMGLGEMVVSYNKRLLDRAPMPSAIQEYCSRLGISLDLVRPLLFCHWVQHISQHVLYETPALSNKVWLKRNVICVLDLFQEGANRKLNRDLVLLLTREGRSLGAGESHQIEHSTANRYAQFCKAESRNTGNRLREFQKPQDLLAIRKMEYRRVLEQLDKAGIEYCLLRDRLDGRDKVKDLDILIAQSSLNLCREMLHQSGYLMKQSPQAPFKMVFFFYRDGLSLCLDIHWKAIQNGIIYMDERKMLARRLHRDGQFFLSEEDELIHLVLHNFLRSGPLRSSSLMRIRELLNRGLDWEYIQMHLDEFRLSTIFQEACQWIRAQETSQVGIGVIRKKMVRVALRARRGNLLRYLRFKLRRLEFQKRKGGLIAIVGPDGAGKSTVVAAVKRRSGAIHGLKVETAYLGPWGQMKMPWIQMIRQLGMTPSMEPWGIWLMERIARRTVSSNVPPCPQGSLAFLFSKWIKSIVKGCLFYFTIYLELCYRYLDSVFLNIRTGRWVVADRYITDLRYLYKGEPMPNYRFLRFLVCRFFPRPNLFVFLDNRPEVINLRKGDLSVEQIKRFRNLYLKAIRKDHYEVISTNRSPEDIADLILERILRLSISK